MRVLIVGAYGQVGQELIRALKPMIGLENIICADIRLPPTSVKVTHH
jgi:dTDP-4-dehydrorhamnose reductase